MRKIVIAVVLLMAHASDAVAEIEKLAIVCDTGICFYWWPRLPELEGWHHDRGSSLRYEANTLAPDGFTFGNAEAVIYAVAVYKPRKPAVKSLDMLIENDKKDFQKTRGVIISEASPLTTADGQKLRTFTFFPAKKGNWERVAYGEEGDFYLLFTVSSRSEAGFKRAAVAYEALVGRYQEKLLDQGTPPGR